MADRKVTVYSAGPACIQCARTERELMREGIPFKVVLLKDAPDVYKWATEEMHYAQAPIVVVKYADGSRESWSGFRLDRIRGLGKD